MGFCAPLNPGVHPTSKSEKPVCRNLATPIAEHKNEWESDGLMDSYYVIGVTAIPYPGFGVLINIVYEDIAYCVTIGDIP